MSSYLHLKIEGSVYQEIIPNMNVVRDAMPLDARKHLNQIFTQYLVKYGVEKACELVKGKTVEEIFAEYQSEVLPPIDSGEMDGLRWNLYEAPKSDLDQVEGDGT